MGNEEGVWRTIRKQKRIVNSCKAAGLKEDAQSANIKLRRLETKYTEFSKAAGLPEQTERKNVLYADETGSMRTSFVQKLIASTPKSDTMDTEAGKGGAGVQTIGKIDIEKYRVVSENIRTDEVVITRMNAFDIFRNAIQTTMKDMHNTWPEL